MTAPNIKTVLDFDVSILEHNNLPLVAANTAKFLSAPIRTGNGSDRLLDLEWKLSEYLRTEPVTPVAGSDL